jgi:hypothetical protein
MLLRTVWGSVGEKSVRSPRQQRSGLLCVGCLCEKVLELPTRVLALVMQSPNMATRQRSELPHPTCRFCYLWSCYTPGAICALQEPVRMTTEVIQALPLMTNPRLAHHNASLQRLNTHHRCRPNSGIPAACQHRLDCKESTRTSRATLDGFFNSVI